MIRTSGFSPTARASSRVRRQTIDLGAQTLMKYTSGREKGLKNRAPYDPVWFTARSARCCDQPTALRGRDQARGGDGWGVNRSIGSGKRMVEFFSAAIPDTV